METSYQLKLLSLSKSKSSSPVPAHLGNSMSLALKCGHGFTGKKFLYGEGEGPAMVAREGLTARGSLCFGRFIFGALLLPLVFPCCDILGQICYFSS